MTLVTLASIGLAAFVGLLLASGQRDRLTVAVNSLSRASSPVDQAEKLLARRYARGSISGEEYHRMMAILRS